ncbi:MAG: class I SAM-dependent methyltransferase [Desulfobacteraceae bacterium]|nr:class I SAM-dependent methyltransferase [Desulfobacteraceae bacterium]
MTDRWGHSGTWEDMLRQTFKGADIKVEDLYLLEACDLEGLKERVTPRAIAAVLHANPSLERIWGTRYPEICTFIDKVTTEYGPASTRQELEFLSDKIVWEIAELLIYHRDPKFYEKRAAIDLDLKELTEEVNFDNRIVVDVGAGTGRIAFQAAPLSRWVFAVEPVTSFRRFMRERIRNERIKNVYVIDGLLSDIPLPDKFVDVLTTCQAFGWSLLDELQEIERVMRPGGIAIHFSGIPIDENGTIHPVITSDKWGYKCQQLSNQGALHCKYVRRF